MTDLPSPRHDPDAVPPCPVCGAALDVDWIEIRDLTSPLPMFLPGKVHCGHRPPHDVSAALRLFGTVTVAHRGHRDTASCPGYLLDRWRAEGWFPTDLEHQTTRETVEHEVWCLDATRT